MKPFSVAWAWSALLCAGLPHCAEPISAPSAFSEQQYLCDTEHRAEFDADVAQCRDVNVRDPACAGFVSLRGTIDSQAVVLAAPVTGVARVENQRPGGTTAHGLTVSASAPYFGLELGFTDISGYSSSPDYALPALDGVSSAVDHINLEARGGNYLSNFIHQTRTVEVLEPTEIRFAFATDLTRGGHLDGCLDVFPGTP